MKKTILADVDGFTPIIDELAREYGLVRAAVFGRMWRYCQMSDGVCRASLETISTDLGVDRATIMRHAQGLVEDGYLEDTTPDLRNRPHIYRDTGKAGLRISIGVAHRNSQSETVAESNTTVAQSNTTVAESQLKKVIKKQEETNTSGDAKKPRHGREINPLEKELTQYFSELTHLKIPEPKTKKDWADAQGSWFKPIAYILDLANGRGRDLVKQTVEKMRADKLTISNPRSIEKVASALYAENYRRYSPNAQTEKEFDPFASLNRYLIEKEKENGEVQNA